MNESLPQDDFVPNSIDGFLTNYTDLTPYPQISTPHLTRKTRYNESNDRKDRFETDLTKNELSA